MVKSPIELSAVFPPNEKKRKRLAQEVFEDGKVKIHSDKEKRVEKKNLRDSIAHGRATHFKEANIIHFASERDGEIMHETNNTSTRKAKLSSRAGKSGQLKARARELLSFRQALPIAAHAEEIRSKLRDNDVLLLVGETGSGKSTQLPQYLVEESWCKSKNLSAMGKLNGHKAERGGNSGFKEETKVGGCIAVTQPRRLAAISLASRVAAEMGTPLGSSSPASQVGYSVRFDTSVSPSTRIKFLTEGMLLQEMLEDRFLRKYSAIIVDEVHERSINVDLVLAFLRQMVNYREALIARGGSGIKVVVMSATADMQEINNFFAQPKSYESNVSIGKKKCKVVAQGHTRERQGCQPNDCSDSESSWSGLSSPSPQSTTAPLSTASYPQISSANSPNQDHLHISSCYIKGRLYPVQVIFTPSPVQDILEAALQAILRIHTYEPLPGDILVFLTGQDAVENVVSLCREASKSLERDSKDRQKVPKLIVWPLFAALPQNAQQLVFDKTPAGTRKVIVSTNIAETSLTVPGIRYVVDSGKCKQKQFRSRLGLESLLVKPISASAANQRKGRAGREAPGTCYRLYTEKDYLALALDNDPEILRCDLSQLVLNLKAHGVDDVVNFPLVTSPRREALERAFLHLLQLQALDRQTGKISETGTLMARLPLPPSLGRVLLAAASPSSDCVAECIDIISALSVENIFLNSTTEEEKEVAEEVRRSLYRREGDHLTYLAAVQAYAAESSDRKFWCRQRQISHRAMQAVMDVRKQLTTLSQQNGLLPLSSARITTTNPLSNNLPSESKLDFNTSSTNNIANDQSIEPLATRILKTFLTGFLSNTARLSPDGTYHTIINSPNLTNTITSSESVSSTSSSVPDRTLNHQLVAIHPSSVLFGRRCEAIMYNEFVFTQRSYARVVSAVQMDWLEEMFLRGAE